MRQISEDHRTKEDETKEEIFILQDNLDDQVQKKKEYMCQEGYNNLCWCYHHNYTHDLYPPDSGAGNQIRFLFGVKLDECLWDYGNVEQCYLGLFHASH